MTDYSVYKSNGQLLVNLVPHKFDRTATSLVLEGDDIIPQVGGQINPTNLVHLLEHFANTTPPNNPIAGQIWYNTTTQMCSVYNGTTWQGLSTGVPTPTQVPTTGTAQLVEASTGALSTLWQAVNELMLRVDAIERRAEPLMEPK